MTWPVSPRLLADGRFLLTTSIGMPQKAFNVRRNPKVSLLYSEPTGSRVTAPGAVLIQGDATAEDRIVTDMSSDKDLTAFMETIPAGNPRAHSGVHGSADASCGRTTFGCSSM